MLDPRTYGIRGALHALNRRRIHIGPPTLADRVFAPTLLMDIVLILCGVALVALSAQFVVPLWPVPSTGQIIGVLLVGYALGSLRGGLSLLIYTVLGASGVPVFSRGASDWEYLFGATGGYLFGFIVMAVLAGYCAARGWDRRFVSNFACSLTVTLVMYTIGVGRLMVVQQSDLGSAIEEGFLPLIFAGVIKVLVVAILVPAVWSLDSRLVRAAQAAPVRGRPDTLRG